MTAAKAANTVQSPEIVPRDYGLVLRRDDDKFYFFPANHALAGALRNRPEVVSSRLGYWQRYKSGAQAYPPKFPIPLRKRGLLDPQTDVYDEFREAVKAVEGTYTLVDAEPGEVFADISVKGDVLSGHVKSKSQRDSTKPRDYKVTVRNAFLDGHGEPDVFVLDCKCPDHAYSIERGGRDVNHVACIHIAALMDEFYSRYHNEDVPRRAVDFRSRKRSPFQPFSFADNWVYRDGRWEFKHADLAALEMDVWIAYYIGHNGRFGINRRLLEIPDAYSPTMLEAVRRGDARYEVVKQERKADKDKARASALEFLHRQIDRTLKHAGFRPDGLCLELGRPAYRYSDGSSVVNVGVDSQSLLWYAARRNFSQNVEPFAREQAEQTPYSQLFRFQSREDGARDDCTRRRSEVMYGIPPALELPIRGGLRERIAVPENLKREYRRLVEAHAANPRSVLRIAGLEK